MSYGKITIHQGPNGRTRGIFIDGQRLPHARGYRITNSVDGFPMVTVEFVATAEIVTAEHLGHHVESVENLAGEPEFVCHTCGDVQFTDPMPQERRVESGEYYGCCGNPAAHQHTSRL